jgi:hypothetical protein
MFIEDFELLQIQSLKTTRRSSRCHRMEPLFRISNSLNVSRIFGSGSASSLPTIKGYAFDTTLKPGSRVVAVPSKDPSARTTMAYSGDNRKLNLYITVQSWFIIPWVAHQ